MVIDQAQRQDKRIQEYQDWFNISNLNGWLVYKQELEDRIQYYTSMLDNVELDPMMLKNCQLIKKGLKIALDIPKILEIKAKTARKENR